MINNPKWLYILIGNCILIFLIQLINSTLASFTINIYISALFIFIPILSVSYTTGLVTVFLTGLLLDASATIPFGTTAFLLSCAYTAYFSFCDRYKPSSDWHNMLLLQSANAITFSFLSVTVDSGNYSNPYFWISLLINLLFSQILLLFITPWFLSLQYSLQLFLTPKMSFKTEPIHSPENHFCNKSNP